MIAIMILAHLLGDYLFQWTVIVRWKFQSLSGVLAHGCIVTLSALACTGLTAPNWWPFALLIGLSHTAIDAIRARLIHTSNPTHEMAWYLLDQGLHIATIVLTVLLAGDPLAPSPALTGDAWSNRQALAHAPVVTAPPTPSPPFGPLSDRRIVWLAIGYLLLLQPSWAFLRFLVRGIWGAEAAPPLNQGEKYRPMVKRVLIATSVFSGAFYLVPLILLPGHLTHVSLKNGKARLTFGLPDHWAEPLLGTLLAIGVGLGLRIAL